MLLFLDRSWAVPKAARWQRQLAWAISAVLGIAVCSNALHPELLKDDFPILQLDPRVVQNRWLELSLGDYWPPGSGYADRLYRPLVTLSFAVQRGAEPSAFRFVNILLHAAVSALVCHWAATQWKSATAGAVAGVLFAVHPIHTEPLNMIVGRADIAATFFALAGVMTTSRRPLVGSLLFALAILSKEQVALLPAVLLLSNRRSAAAWTAVVVLYVGLRFAALGTFMRQPDSIPVADNVLAHPETDLPQGGSAFLARYGTPIALFGKAASLLVFPEPLCNDYSYASIVPVRRLGDPRLLFGATLLSGTLLAIVKWRRTPVALGLAWTIASYAVVSNAPIVIGTIFAERHLYLPSAGFCMAVGGFAMIPRRSVMIILLIFAAGAGAAKTWSRNAEWRDFDALVLADFPKQPNSCRLLTQFATIEMDAGRPTSAVEHCRRAAAICPSYPLVDAVLGLSLYRLGEDVEALEALQRSFRFGGSSDEEVVVAAADLLAKRGDGPAAERLLETQLKRFRNWSIAKERFEALRANRRP
jgi:protein O-mannosyl-transferase